MTYLQTIKKLYNIYFTNFPYTYFYYQNRVSNFGLIGVGYDLIYAQQTFWFGNIGSLVFIYNINNTDMFYYNGYILVWSLCLYIISANKVINSIKYI